MHIQTHTGEMMADSTTGTEDNQPNGAQPNPTDPKPTDEQTPNNGDNLDTSKSTEQTPADGDKKPEAGGDGGTPAPKFDPDLDDWAAKTNRPKPTTDRERELYQEIRNGQREYSRSQQAKDNAQNLRSTVQNQKPTQPQGDEDDDDDDLTEDEKRSRKLESDFYEERAARLQAEYFVEKQVTSEEVSVMGEILQEKLDRAKARGGEKAAAQTYKYWTDPEQLADWHELAQARIAKSSDHTQIEEEAARKERERISQESKANGPARGASTFSTDEKTEDEQRLERFSNWET
jgi:hypothetical protein